MINKNSVQKRKKENKLFGKMNIIPSLTQMRMTEIKRMKTKRRWKNVRGQRRQRRRILRCTRWKQGAWCGNISGKLCLRWRLAACVEKRFALLATTRPGWSNTWARSTMSWISRWMIVKRWFSFWTLHQSSVSLWTVDSTNETTTLIVNIFGFQSSELHQY